MIKLSGREKFFIVTTILLITGYFLFFVVFRMLEDREQGLDQQIAAQEAKLSKALRIVEKGRTMEGQFSVYRDRFRQTKSQQQLMSSMLTEVEEIAGGLNLKILELKPNAPQKESGLNLYSVNLMVSGPFNDVVQFLHLLQKEPFSFDVKKFRFDRELSGVSSEVKTNIVLEKMYFSDEFLPVPGNASK